MSVIYVVVPFRLDEYVEFYHRVHVSAFGCEMDWGHDGVDGAKWLVVFQQVFCEI
jgi:hypothetical protein